MLELPRTARIWKHFLGKDFPYSSEEHLLADLRDLMLVNTYYTQVEAGKDFKPTQWKQIQRDTPEPLWRPGDKPKEVQFTPPEELADFFGGVGRPHGRKK